LDLFLELQIFKQNLVFSLELVIAKYPFPAHFSFQYLEFFYLLSPQYHQFISSSPHKDSFHNTQISKLIDNSPLIPNTSNSKSEYYLYY